jgi:hypothetical protein
MFEMFETALDMEVERRRESPPRDDARGTRPKSGGRQIPGIAKARHVWVVIVNTRL